jgi:uncharacterized protein YbjT (DUF2867 family)
MTSTPTNTGTTLVLGASGKTGRRVVERLQARRLPVRLGSRSGQPPFEWSDAATWPAALQGVESVYLAYFPDIAVPGASDAIREFTAQALESGVRRVVLLSGRGEHQAELCEQIVRDSGIAYTVLRASWFAQNFSESFFLEPILSGEVALPIGPVGEPFIDADDIADAAVAALTDDRHAGQTYEVTGPRLWTFEQAVAEIARVTKRQIRYVQVPLAAYVAELKAIDLPPDVISLISFLFIEVLDGRNATVTDGIQRALGRPARDFSDYVRAAAATGVWDAPNAARA